MYLGREGLGGNEINVFALERMSNFLQNNGPWDQLVDLKNISLNSLENLQPVNLSKDLKVIPIKVPHRDEYSETVGYKIVGKTKKVLFIPDIDKWSEWERDIIQEVKNVDYALIDGTFYNGSELNRDMSEIPHPSIEETIGLFLNEPIQERNKIYFIHINHTNPILTNKNNIKSNIENFGFNIAQKGLKLFLD
jgi:pyrroloquinoline quinone biosynthesis protein B